MSFNFKTGCSACGRHILFPQENAGQEIVCPHCGKPVILGSNLIEIPLAARSEEEQEELLAEAVKQKTDVAAVQAAQAIQNIKTHGSHEPFPILTWIQLLIFLAVVIVVAIAIVKFVLFWAFE